MITHNAQPEPVLLADYYRDRYKPERTPHGRSDRAYLCAIKWFDDYLQKHATADAALLDRVAGFRTWMAGTGCLSQRTADSYANVMSAMLRHTIEAPTPPQSPPGSLGHFLGGYIVSRGDVKPSTHANLQRTAADLLDYFGHDKPLVEITAGDADDFRRWLVSDRDLAPNTVRRVCGRGKQFFRAAVRKRLIESSPFGDMHNTNVRANHQRFYFVSAEETAKVLAACPSVQWRVLFALNRYGGLRNPSETLGLRWSDIDWRQSRMTVRSPKTEHIEGHESRVVPLFSDLRTHLEAARDEAGESPESPFVVTIYRGLHNARANMRTPFVTILLRAGIVPWPKLFHNLRATRQTELCQQFPQHVVCAWLGNTHAVATEHYLRTTEADFARAAGLEAPKASRLSKLCGMFGRARALKGGAV